MVSAVPEPWNSTNSGGLEVQAAQNGCACSNGEEEGKGRKGKEKKTVEGKNGNKARINGEGKKG